MIRCCLMKATHVIGLLGFTTAILFSLLLARPSQAQDGAPIADRPNVQWEYMCLIPDEKGPDLHDERIIRLQKQLETVGKDGWELIEMPYLKGVRYQTMVFKRQKN